jgi:hypothetical protein
MNEDPSKSPYRPEEFGQPVQHDAPTEMFSAPPAAGPAHMRGGQAPWTQPRPTIRPEQLIRKNAQQQLLPASLPAKLAYLWKSDPAYKVLFVAIGVVVVCSIFGLFLLSNAFSHGSTTSPQTANTSAEGSSTPGSNNAANTAQTKPTQIPTLQPTATPLPTPTPIPTSTPAPTPTPVPAMLNAQITSIPQTADNHTSISVTVTSIPGATVWLTIITGADPPYLETEQKSTDGNGMAVITWHINEHSFNAFSRQTIAQVTAHAEGANGQQVQSQPAQITINLAN